MAELECERVHEGGPQLALGVLSGRDRADALVHPQDRPACAQHVRALSVIGDPPGPPGGALAGARRPAAGGGGVGRSPASAGRAGGPGPARIPPARLAGVRLLAEDGSSSAPPTSSLRRVAPYSTRVHAVHWPPPF